MTKGEKRAKKKKTKTETIGFRLEPKLRFAAELAARKQRRSLSNFIEWAVEEAVKKVPIKLHKGDFDEGAPPWNENASDAIQNAWDVEEADRFVKVALNYPLLLNHEEEILWKLICETGFFWKGNMTADGKFYYQINKSSCDFKAVREHWNKLNQVAKEELSKDSLPSILDKQK